METLKYNNKVYSVDSFGFLVNSSEWDENFAEAIASELNISGGLTDKHWEVIRFIRETFIKTNSCPVVYDTCKQNNLTLHELKELFPAGYQRGACKLAGITYKEGYLRYHYVENPNTLSLAESEDKTYTIDKYGFLVNPSEWDTNFVILKSSELKMPSLKGQHWQIISYLRDKYYSTKNIPTVYETCEDNGIDIEGFNNLFPDGYHRGAVKLAGLRLF